MTAEAKPTFAEFVARQGPSYRFRFQRAEEHLRALETQISAFVRKNPCSVTPFIEEQGDFRKKVYRLASINEYPLVNDWGLLIGDVVHAVRAVLDSLVYFLIASNTRTTPSPNCGFPIFSSSPAAYMKKGRSKLNGVPIDGIAVIDGVQPYLNGQNAREHPLAVLHDLDIWDKHRAATLCTWSLMDSAVFVIEGVPMPNVHSVGGPYIGPVQHGTILAEAEVTTSSAEVHAREQFSFEIAFFPASPGAGKPVLAALNNIADFVRVEVLAKLEPILAREFAKQ